MARNRPAGTENARQTGENLLDHAEMALAASVQRGETRSAFQDADHALLLAIYHELRHGHDQEAKHTEALTALTEAIKVLTIKQA